MVRFLDLEDELQSAPEEDPPHEHIPPNLNITNRLPAALTCYPIASQLATYLDLNTLHQLSRTCRQVRTNLLQYRSMLIDQALRCSYDILQSQELSDQRHSNQNMSSKNNILRNRLTSGKLGPCARDMVGECRRCGRVVCRNCVIKPPPTATLKGRHRRLCRTCVRVPIDEITRTSQMVTDSDHLFDDQSRSTSFVRSPCTCQDSVWICQPCGIGLRPADTTYIRGWAWRSRYSACGGIGAGLGEGNEGVECGQEAQCRAARVIEKDVECDAEELAALEAEMMKAEIDGRHWEGSCYSTQEMVGIGGKVKKKVKKQIRVGAIVKEYEDERATECYLEREHTGANRSWCSWCLRVVLGRKDLEDGSEDTEQMYSSSPEAGRTAR